MRLQTGGLGATAAIPISGNISYRAMGELTWDFVVSIDHPLAKLDNTLTDSELIKYPCICLQDSSRILPKRTTWLLDNQRRLVVPNWHSEEQCFIAGFGIGIMPSHRSKPLIEKGVLVKRTINSSIASSPCCLAWNSHQQSPAIEWLLNYLGDSEKLHMQWLR